MPRWPIGDRFGSPIGTSLVGLTHCEDAAQNTRLVSELDRGKMDGFIGEAEKGSKCASTEPDCSPATDGRPDSRPDVREEAPGLGNLESDFDFDQAPRSPLIRTCACTTVVST